MNRLIQKYLLQNKYGMIKFYIKNDFMFIHIINYHLEFISLSCLKNISKYIKTFYSTHPDDYYEWYIILYFNDILRLHISEKGHYIEICSHPFVRDKDFITYDMYNLITKKYLNI